MSYFIKTEDGWIKTRASTLESAIKIADEAELYQIAQGNLVDPLRIVAVKAAMRGWGKQYFWIKIPPHCQMRTIEYEGIIIK